MNVFDFNVLAVVSQGIYNSKHLQIEGWFTTVLFMWIQEMSNILFVVDYTVFIFKLIKDTKSWIFCMLIAKYSENVENKSLLLKLDESLKHLNDHNNGGCLIKLRA